MVATAVISIGILGFFGAFSFISRSLHISRTHTLATNLGQEKIESLKNLSYFELAITTSPLVDNSLTPGVAYDTVMYPPETIPIGGITFKRYTYVALAQIDSGGTISTVTYTFPDTGMKQITTTIVWVDGGVAKKWSLTNLLENPTINPLDTGLSGTIKIFGLGTTLSGAQVRIDEDPDWNSTAASNGTYSFRVYHGSYTVRASSAGFYDGVSLIQDAEPGISVPVPDIFLTQIASGTVKGNAWLNPNLVISQVMASSSTAVELYGAVGSQIVEHVELFNPTTAQINITGAVGVVASPLINLNYGGATPPQDVPAYMSGAVFVSSYVASSHYYLIANASFYMLNGQWMHADAYYLPNVLGVNPNGCAGLQLYDAAGTLDAVGWTGSGACSAGRPEYFETTAIPTGNGIGQGNQIVRVSSPTAGIAAITRYGRAYDSGTNKFDFVWPDITGYTNIYAQPYHENTNDGATSVYVGLTSAPVIAGVPAVGAVVASSDPYSGSTVAVSATISSGALSLPYAPFTLIGVTTGTWQITLASGSYYNQYAVVNIVQNASTGVPNGGTLPAWAAANVSSAMLSSGSLSGFVKGVVTDITDAPIPGIVVTAGGVKKTTGPNGSYFIVSTTGPVEVVCNPNSDPGFNAQYVQLLAVPTLTTSEILTQDFTLSKGGSLQGYLTTGTTPLPNYTVVALIGGSQAGQAASNASGYFTIRNLSTATYTVEAALEMAQDSTASCSAGGVCVTSTPNLITATVTPSNTVFIGTFTILGALGGIIGSAKFNGATLTSGALLIASTGTLSANPSAIVASSSPAQTPIYAASTKADGTFSLPVRGSNTYYLSVYVPTISGTTVSITTKTFSNIYVSPNLDTTFNLTIP